MRKLFLFLVSAVLLSACVHYDPFDPNDSSATKFSVLGDSYSTFEGYVYPDSNECWEHYSEIGVNDVEKMWWYRVAVEMEWSMERNNSFTGTLICNYHEFPNGDHYMRNSFIHRMYGLGNPDVIFILGGTNDVYKNAPFGDYVYANWTDEQLCSFRPAMAYLLDNVKRLYPDAKLYFLLETDPFPDYITEEIRQNLIESVHRITNHYGVDCIDLDIHKFWNHPNVKGQKDIARQVMERLEVDFNV